MSCMLPSRSCRRAGFLKQQITIGERIDTLLSPSSLLFEIAFQTHSYLNDARKLVGFRIRLSSRGGLSLNAAGVRKKL